MRTILNKVSLLFFAVIAIVVCMNLPGVKNEVQAETYGDWEYEIAYDGTISIERYRGSDSIVTIPSQIEGKNVTSIGEYAFSDCDGLTRISIPSGVTSIGASAFCWCRGLTRISIPSSVTSIGASAFEDCSGLTSISIPSSVESIGDCAFYWCSGLTSISIPSSVTSIGECAFSRCSRLTSISIPSSVTSIGAGVFYDCSSLTSIKVDSKNTKYDSRNNCNAIIEKSTNTLIAGCKSTKIPSSVTSIGDYAFYWYSGLTSISIPNSVTSIGDYAFYGCSSLTSISIPSSVTEIGSSAFEGCSGLTSIIIPSSVTYIGSDAFEDCSDLTIYVETKDQMGLVVKSGFDKKRVKLTSELIPAAGKMKSLTNTATGIKLAWTKNSKVTGYIVYRSVNGSSYKKLTTLKGASKTSYIDTKTKNGSKYSYKIYTYKTIGDKNYINKTGKANYTYRLTGTTVKAKNSAQKTVKLTWSKNAKATGYEVKLVIGKSTKSYKVKGYKNVAKTITKLTKGKTYKVYVRVYKTVSKKTFYSAWSKVVSVKIKK